MAGIVDFLNHGLLPFVGREEQVAGICRFVAGTVDAPELRLRLLVGEAGSGKSRLVAEAIERIRSDRILPVSIRIYPDTSDSVVPLLADALDASDEIGRLLREPVDRSAASALAALRRLARLRPLCLFVEDLHLLEPGGVAELTRLLSGLFNDPISVVVATRPITPDVRGAIEPYIVDETKLDGFARETLDRLWHELLQNEPPEGILDDLLEATRGNPLAVRSALRGAFRRGTIEIDGTILPERYPALLASFREGASRFGEGLALGLVPEEREALARLAILGEIFAVETADHILGDRATSMLEQLAFKGMLGTASGSATPLGSGRTGQGLLTFTHTLVHLQILEDSPVTPTEIADMIAERLPLYSRLPVERLADGVADIDLPPERIARLLEAMQNLAAHADSRGDVPWSLTLQQINRTILETLADRLDPEELAYRKAWLAVHAVGSLRRDHDAWSRACEEAAPLLEGAGDSQRWLELRLLGLHFTTLYDDSREEYRQTLEEAGKIIEICDAVASSGPAIKTFRFVALRAAAEDDWGLLREIEDRIDIDVDPSEMKTWGYADLIHLLCLNWSTPEEFAERARIFTAVESPARWRNVVALYPMLRWLLDAGRADAFLAHVDGAIEIYARYSAVEYIVLYRGLASVLRYLLGTGTVDPMEEIEGLPIDQIQDPDDFFDYVCGLLAIAALMCGDTTLAERASGKTHPVASNALLLGREIPEEIEDPTERMLADVATSIADGAEPVDELRQLLERPLLRITDPPLRLAALKLADDVTERSEDPDGIALASAMSTAVEDLLAWYADPHRRFHRPILSLLDAHGSSLSAAERRSWKERAERIGRDRIVSSGASDEDRRRRLTVIGQMTIAEAGSEPKEIRGERVTACIGALVANSLMRSKLDDVDFAQRATGEDDPAKAKKILKVAMFRTREAIGSDSVTTDEDAGTPIIDRDVLRVDLFEMVDALAEASRSIADRNLARALRSTVLALDLFGSEVMLPGLYDPIFEAIREEQEAQLREVVIRLAERLNDATDHASAELLMRRALGVIPEDEEFADLLRMSLRSQGHLADAERVKVVD